MDRERFDDGERLGSSSSSRRAVLAGASGGLLAMTPTAHGEQAAPSPRRTRCQRPKPPAPQPTCEERCGTDWVYCFNRPDGGPLCGNFYQILCAECATDNDCVGSAQTYCVVDRVVLETGQRVRWDCPEYAVGICAKIERV